MSLQTLDSVKISGLAADSFPVADDDNILVGSDVSPVQGESIVVTGYNVSAITLKGWTVTGPTNSRLYLDIVEEAGDTLVTLRREPYPSAEILAQGVWSDVPSLPADLELLSYSQSGVEARVTVENASENTGMEVLIPFSSCQPALTESATGIIGNLELNGVHFDNSDEGALAWSYEHQSPDYRFTLSSPDGEVAEAVVSTSVVFPEDLAITQLNDSGITGSLTLLGYPGNSSGLALVRYMRGIHIDGTLMVDGDLQAAEASRVTGSVTLAGGLVCGDLKIPNLTSNKYNRSPLAVDSSGSVIRDVVQVRQFLGHGNSLPGSPTDGEVLLLDLSSFGMGEIPEAWWKSGKRISIKTSFDWERLSTSTSVSFVLSMYGYGLTQELFSVALPTSGSALTGTSLLDIDIIVRRNTGEGDTLDFRGSYRLDDEVGHISLLDCPASAYVMTARALFGEDDFANLFRLRTFSAVTHELPRPLFNADF